ncbi:MAG: bifunctional adenosylcobinamide kinase/adenosylcobinamide-phosphate guanylyltransferase [Candidatus Cloacimonetes bacterium]|nr:bifunctional adenosylcobinamide kinase/adenosylcobinamide-phosphate guanylyltransferase [Candidatus Cloacimonadota bacterium]
MGKIIYVTGGARSGKSSFAEQKAMQLSDNRIYLATAVAFDDEMKKRVELHRRQRGPEWKTVEGYRALPHMLTSRIDNEDLILLDCLTIMVTNLMLAEHELDWDIASQDDVIEIEQKIRQEVEDFLYYAREFEGTTIIVSNELGMGIVPNNNLSRYFRDIAGRMNQLAAQHADEAYLLVSGLPVKLK